MTRTFAVLYVSRKCWEELYRELEKADSLDIPCCGTIDMHGIGLKMRVEEKSERKAPRRYPPEAEQIGEPRTCIWCGGDERVAFDPPRMCEEGAKQGYIGPCQFDPESLPLHVWPLKPLKPFPSDIFERVQRPSVASEPLPYDHDGARRIRELDGRGTE